MMGGWIERSTPAGINVTDYIKKIRDQIHEVMGIPSLTKQPEKKMDPVKLMQQIEEAKTVEAPPCNLPLRVSKIKEIRDASTIRINWESSESDNEITKAQAIELQEATHPGTGKAVGGFSCRKTYNDKFKASWTTTEDRV